MATAEEILKKASGRTRTVWVCPDGELYSQWQSAEGDYERARQARGTLADDDETARLRDEAERLRGEVDEALVEFRLREVRPGRVNELRADHALPRKEAEKLGLRAGALDEESFWPALAAESIEEPNFTVDQARELLDSSQAVRSPLLAALNELHGVVSGDPKRQVDTARHRSSETS